MSTMRRSIVATLAALMISAAGVGATFAPAQASEIRFVVNSAPITTYDVQRRAAFLRLQRAGGNVNERAGEEMIDQTLRMQEMARLGVRVSDDEVSQAYQRFAQQNNLTTAQLDQILNQQGVTRDHFREFIRAQIGWGQAVSARGRHESGGQLTEQQVVRKIQEQGGQKPSATEYVLQQVIFVVPAAERGARLGQRKREAEALRARFSSCETTRQGAQGILDVTVRDLGRVLEPELPPDWESLIKATQAGGTTAVRETERGAEYLAVCSTRQVSDDYVAQLVFRAEQASSEGGEQLSDNYTAELRERANIVRR
jgi:peptidyl-prolyl cis-trans isomerase SurA